MSIWPLLGTGLVFAALLAGLIWMLRRRRRSRRAVPPPQPVASLDTPDARLLSLAVQARETLVTRFGPSLRGPHDRGDFQRCRGQGGTR